MQLQSSKINSFIPLELCHLFSLSFCEDLIQYIPVCKYCLQKLVCHLFKTWIFSLLHSFDYFDSKFLTNFEANRIWRGLQYFSKFKSSGGPVVSDTYTVSIMDWKYQQTLCTSYIFKRTANLAPNISLNNHFIFPSVTAGKRGLIPK